MYAKAEVLVIVVSVPAIQYSRQMRPNATLANTVNAIISTVLGPMTIYVVVRTVDLWA